MLEFVERIGGALLQRFDVAEGREGDQGDLAGMSGGLIADEIDGVRGRRFVGGAVGPLLLGEGDVVGWGLGALGDYHVVAA